MCVHALEVPVILQQHCTLVWRPCHIIYMLLQTHVDTRCVPASYTCKPHPYFNLRETFYYANYLQHQFKTSLFLIKKASFKDLQYVIKISIVLHYYQKTTSLPYLLIWNFPIISLKTAQNIIYTFIRHTQTLNAGTRFWWTNRCRLGWQEK